MSNHKLTRLKRLIFSLNKCERDLASNWRWRSRHWSWLESREGDLEWWLLSCFGSGSGPAAVCCGLWRGEQRVASTPPARDAAAFCPVAVGNKSTRRQQAPGRQLAAFPWLPAQRIERAQGEFRVAFLSGPCLVSKSLVL